MIINWILPAPIIIEMKFKDLNKTKVDIPSDVFNSTIDLNTYMYQFSKLTLPNVNPIN